jgi:hypothetical protein
LSKEDFIAGEDRRLIPEGRYSAQCIEAKKVRVSQKTTKGTFAKIPKIVLIFVIVDSIYQGIKIPMYINADYKFFNPGSKFYQSWVIATGRKPERRNRMALEVFKGHIFTVGVKTVKPKFGDGTEMSEIFWYSRVDEIYEKEA